MLSETLASISHAHLDLWRLIGGHCAAVFQFRQTGGELESGSSSLHKHRTDVTSPHGRESPLQQLSSGCATNKGTGMRMGPQNGLSVSSFVTSKCCR